MLPSVEQFPLNLCQNPSNAPKVQDPSSLLERRPPHGCVHLTAESDSDIYKNDAFAEFARRHFNESSRNMPGIPWITRSDTSSANSAIDTSCSLVSKVTMARTARPYCNRVGIAVIGLMPTGRRSRPKSLFSKDDLPELTRPNNATSKLLSSNRLIQCLRSRLGKIPILPGQG